MKTSDDIKDICGALAKAQGEFDQIKKNATNTFFKTKYADLDAILKACNPALSKNGLALIQAPSFEEGRVYVKTRLVHSSGQWFETDLSLKPDKGDNAQAIGSAITYARRYSVEAILGVSASIDDDGEEAMDRGPSPMIPQREIKPPAPKACLQDLRIAHSPSQLFPAPTPAKPVTFDKANTKLIDWLEKKLIEKKVPSNCHDEIALKLHGKVMTEAVLDDAISEVTG